MLSEGRFYRFSFNLVPQKREAEEPSEAHTNAELSMYKNARLKMYIFDFPCILQLYMEWRV